MSPDILNLYLHDAGLPLDRDDSTWHSGDIYDFRGPKPSGCVLAAWLAVKIHLVPEG